MQRPIESLFYHDLLRPSYFFDLVERAVVDHGEVVPDRSLFLDAQDPGQFPAMQCRPV
jgi:hypothetical protein